MGKRNQPEEEVDASRIDEYVDVIGNFNPKDIKKKKQIKGAVLQEVQGHKKIIQGSTADTVS